MSEERREHKKEHDPNVFDPNQSESAQPQFRQTPEHQTYTVQKGDTLESISLKFYDDESQWRRIWDANDSILEDPDEMFPGLKIQIPRLEREV